jgi:hypothetical protein
MKIIFWEFDMSGWLSKSFIMFNIILLFSKYYSIIENNILKMIRIEGER